MTAEPAHDGTPSQGHAAPGWRSPLDKVPLLGSPSATPSPAPDSAQQDSEEEEKPADPDPSRTTAMSRGDPSPQTPSTNRSDAESIHTPGQAGRSDLPEPVDNGGDLTAGLADLYADVQRALREQYSDGLPPMAERVLRHWAQARTDFVNGKERDGRRYLDRAIADAEMMAVNQGRKGYANATTAAAIRPFVLAAREAFVRETGDVPGKDERWSTYADLQPGDVFRIPGMHQLAVFVSKEVHLGTHLIFGMTSLDRGSFEGGAPAYPQEQVIHVTDPDTVRRGRSRYTQWKAQQRKDEDKLKRKAATRVVDDSEQAAPKKSSNDAVDNRTRSTQEPVAKGSAIEHESLVPSTTPTVPPSANGANRYQAVRLKGQSGWIVVDTQDHSIPWVFDISETKECFFSGQAAESSARKYAHRLNTDPASLAPPPLGVSLRYTRPAQGQYLGEVTQTVAVLARIVEPGTPASTRGRQVRKPKTKIGWAATTARERPAVAITAAGNTIHFWQQPGMPKLARGVTFHVVGDVLKRKIDCNKRVTVLGHVALETPAQRFDRVHIHQLAPTPQWEPLDRTRALRPSLRVRLLDPESPFQPLGQPKNHVVEPEPTYVTGTLGKQRPGGSWQVMTPDGRKLIITDDHILAVEYGESEEVATNETAAAPPQPLSDLPEELRSRLVKLGYADRNDRWEGHIADTDEVVIISEPHSWHRVAEIKSYCIRLNDVGTFSYHHILARRRDGVVTTVLDLTAHSAPRTQQAPAAPPIGGPITEMTAEEITQELSDLDTWRQLASPHADHPDIASYLLRVGDRARTLDDARENQPATRPPDASAMPVLPPIIDQRFQRHSDLVAHLRDAAPRPQSADQAKEDQQAAFCRTMARRADARYVLIPAAHGRLAVVRVQTGNWQVRTPHRLRGLGPATRVASQRLALDLASRMEDIRDAAGNPFPWSDPWAELRIRAFRDAHGRTLEQALQQVRQEHEEHQRHRLALLHRIHTAMSQRAHRSSPQPSVSEAELTQPELPASPIASHSTVPAADQEGQTVHPATAHTATPEAPHTPARTTADHTQEPHPTSTPPQPDDDHQADTALHDAGPEGWEIPMAELPLLLGAAPSDPLTNSPQEAQQQAAHQANLGRQDAQSDGWTTPFHYIPPLGAADTQPTADSHEAQLPQRAKQPEQAQTPNPPPTSGVEPASPTSSDSARHADQPPRQPMALPPTAPTTTPAPSGAHTEPAPSAPIPKPDAPGEPNTALATASPPPNRDATTRAEDGANVGREGIPGSPSPAQLPATSPLVQAQDTTQDPTPPDNPWTKAANYIPLLGANVADESERIQSLYAAVEEAVVRRWPAGDGPQAEVTVLRDAIQAIDTSDRGTDAYDANAAATATAATAARALVDAIDTTSLPGSELGESLHNLRQHLDLAYRDERKKGREEPATPPPADDARPAPESGQEDLTAEAQRTLDVADGEQTTGTPDVKTQPKTIATAPATTTIDFPGELLSGETITLYEGLGAEGRSDFLITSAQGYAYRLTEWTRNDGVEWQVGQVGGDPALNEVRHHWIGDSVDLEKALAWIRRDSNSRATTREKWERYSHRQEEPVEFSTTPKFEELEPGVLLVHRFGRSGLLIEHRWGWQNDSFGGLPENPDRKSSDYSFYAAMWCATHRGLEAVPTERLRILAVDQDHEEPCAVSDPYAGKCQKDRPDRYVVEVLDEERASRGHVVICAEHLAGRLMGDETYGRHANIAYYLSERKGVWIDWKERAEALTGDLLTTALTAGEVDPKPDVRTALYQEALAVGDKRTAQAARKAAREAGLRGEKVKAAGEAVLAARRARHTEIIATVEASFTTGTENIRAETDGELPGWTPPAPVVDPTHFAAYLHDLTAQAADRPAVDETTQTERETTSALDEPAAAPLDEAEEALAAAEAIRSRLQKRSTTSDLLRVREAWDAARTHYEAGRLAEGDAHLTTARSHASLARNREDAHADFKPLKDAVRHFHDAADEILYPGGAGWRPAVGDYVRSRHRYVPESPGFWMKVMAIEEDGIRVQSAVTGDSVTLMQPTDLGPHGDLTWQDQPFRAPGEPRASDRERRAHLALDSEAAPDTGLPVPPKAERAPASSDKEQLDLFPTQMLEAPAEQEPLPRGVETGAARPTSEAGHAPEARAGGQEETAELYRGAVSREQASDIEGIVPDEQRSGEDRQDQTPDPSEPSTGQPEGELADTTSAEDQQTPAPSAADSQATKAANPESAGITGTGPQAPARAGQPPAQSVRDRQDKLRTRAAALTHRINKLREGMERFDVDLRAIDDVLADAQAAMTAEAGAAASEFREMRRQAIDATRRIIKNESAHRPANLWNMPVGESGAGLDRDGLALRVKELARIRDRAEAESRKFLAGILPVDDTLADICWRVDEFLAQQPDADIGGITALKGRAENALQMLREALVRQSVTPMNPVGKKVNLAEAKIVAVEEDDSASPDDTVLREVITGFRIGDRVLRQAEVVVYADTRPPESTPEPTQEHDSARQAATSPLGQAQDTTQDPTPPANPWTTAANYIPPLGGKATDDSDLIQTSYTAAHAADRSAVDATTQTGRDSTSAPDEPDAVKVEEEHLGEPAPAPLAAAEEALAAAEAIRSRLQKRSTTSDLLRVREAWDAARTHYEAGRLAEGDEHLTTARSYATLARNREDAHADFKPLKDAVRHFHDAADEILYPGGAGWRPAVGDYVRSRHLYVPESTGFWKKVIAIEDDGIRVQSASTGDSVTLMQPTDLGPHGDLTWQEQPFRAPGKPRATDRERRAYLALAPKAAPNTALPEPPKAKRQPASSDEESASETDHNTTTDGERISTTPAAARLSDEEQQRRQDVGGAPGTADGGSTPSPTQERTPSTALPIVDDEFSILFAASSKGLLSTGQTPDGKPDDSLIHLQAEDSAGVLAAPAVVRHLIDQRALRLGPSGALVLTGTGGQRLAKMDLSARPEPAAGDRVLLAGIGRVGVVCGYRTSLGIRYAQVVADRNGWPQGWDTTVYPQYLTILERGVMGQEEAAELYRVAARREQAPDTELAPAPTGREAARATQTSLFETTSANEANTEPAPAPDAKTANGRDEPEARPPTQAEEAGKGPEDSRERKEEGRKGLSPYDEARAAEFREWAGVWAASQAGGPRDVYRDRVASHSPRGQNALAEHNAFWWIGAATIADPLGQFDENARHALAQVPVEGRAYLSGQADELRATLQSIGDQARADFRRVLKRRIATRKGIDQANEEIEWMFGQREEEIRSAVRERVARAGATAAQHGLSEEQAEDFLVAVVGGDADQQIAYGIRGAYPEALRPLHAAHQDAVTYFTAFHTWRTQDDSGAWAGMHHRNWRLTCLELPPLPAADPLTGQGVMRIGEAKLPDGMRWARASELRQGDIYRQPEVPRRGTPDGFDGLHPPEYVIHTHADGREGAIRSVALDSNRGSLAPRPDEWVIILDNPDSALRRKAQKRAKTSLYTGWELPKDEAKLAVQSRLPKHPVGTAVDLAELSTGEPIRLRGTDRDGGIGQWEGYLQGQPEQTSFHRAGQLIDGWVLHLATSPDGDLWQPPYYIAGGNDEEWVERISTVSGRSALTTRADMVDKSPTEPGKKAPDEVPEPKQPSHGEETNIDPLAAPAISPLGQAQGTTQDPAPPDSAWTTPADNIPLLGAKTPSNPTAGEDSSPVDLGTAAIVPTVGSQGETLTNDKAEQLALRPDWTLALNQDSEPLSPKTWATAWALRGVLSDAALSELMAATSDDDAYARWKARHLKAEGAGFEFVSTGSVARRITYTTTIKRLKARLADQEIDETWDRIRLWLRDIATPEATSLLQAAQEASRRLGDDSNSYALFAATGELALADSLRARIKKLRTQILDHAVQFVSQTEVPRALRSKRPPHQRQAEQATALSDQDKRPTFALPGADEVRRDLDRLIAYLPDPHTRRAPKFVSLSKLTPGMVLDIDHRPVVIKEINHHPGRCEIAGDFRGPNRPHWVTRSIDLTSADPDPRLMLAPLFPTLRQLVAQPPPAETPATTSEKPEQETTNAEQQSDRPEPEPRAEPESAVSRQEPQTQSTAGTSPARPAEEPAAQAPEPKQRPNEAAADTPAEQLGLFGSDEPETNSDRELSGGGRAAARADEGRDTQQTALRPTPTTRPAPAPDSTPGNTAGAADQADSGRYLSPAEIAESRGPYAFVTREDEATMFGPNSKKRITQLASQTTQRSRGSAWAPQTWYKGKYVGFVNANGPKLKQSKAHLPFSDAPAPVFANRETALAYLALASEAHDNYSDLSHITPEQRVQFRFLNIDSGGEQGERIAAAVQGAEAQAHIKALRDVTEALRNGQSLSGNVADDLGHVIDEARWLYENAPGPRDDKFHGTLESLITWGSEYLDTLRPEDHRAQNHAIKRDEDAAAFLHDHTAGDSKAPADTVAPETLHNGDLIKLSGIVEGILVRERRTIMGYVIGEPIWASPLDIGSKAPVSGWRITISEEPFAPVRRSIRHTFLIPEQNKRITRFARAEDTGLPTDEILRRRAQDGDPRTLAPPAMPSSNTSEANQLDLFDPRGTPAKEPSEVEVAPSKDSFEGEDYATAASRQAGESAQASAATTTSTPDGQGPDRSPSRQNEGTADDSQQDSTPRTALLPSTSQNDNEPAEPAAEAEPEVAADQKANVATPVWPDAAVGPFETVSILNVRHNSHAGQLFRHDWSPGLSNKERDGQWWVGCECGLILRNDGEWCRTKGDAYRLFLWHADGEQGGPPPFSQHFTTDLAPTGQWTENGGERPQPLAPGRWRYRGAEISYHHGMYAADHQSQRFYGLEMADVVDAVNARVQAPRGVKTSPPPETMRNASEPDVSNAAGRPDKRRDFTPDQAELGDYEGAETLNTAGGASTREDTPTEQLELLGPNQPTSPDGEPTDGDMAQKDTPTATHDAVPAIGGPATAPTPAAPDTTIQRDDVPSTEIEHRPRPQRYTETIPLATDPAYELRVSGLDGQIPHPQELRYADTVVATVHRTVGAQFFAQLTVPGLPADITTLTSTPQEAAHQGGILHAVLTGTSYGEQPMPAPGETPQARAAVLRTALRDAALQHADVITAATQRLWPHEGRSNPHYKELARRLRQMAQAVENHYNAPQMNSALSTVEHAAIAWNDALPEATVYEERQVLAYPLAHLRYDVTRLRAQLQTTVEAVQGEQTAQRQRARARTAPPAPTQAVEQTQRLQPPAPDKHSPVVQPQGTGAPDTPAAPEEPSPEASTAAAEPAVRSEPAAAVPRTSPETKQDPTPQEPMTAHEDEPSTVDVPTSAIPQPSTAQPAPAADKPPTQPLHPYDAQKPAAQHEPDHTRAEQGTPADNDELPEQQYATDTNDSQTTNGAQLTPPSEARPTPPRGTHHTPPSPPTPAGPIEPSERTTAPMTATPAQDTMAVTPTATPGMQQTPTATTTPDQALTPTADNNTPTESPAPNAGNPTSSMTPTGLVQARARQIAQVAAREAGLAPELVSAITNGQQIVIAHATTGDDTLDQEVARLVRAGIDQRIRQEDDRELARYAIEIRVTDEGQTAFSEPATDDPSTDAATERLYELNERAAQLFVAELQSGKVRDAKQAAHYLTHARGHDTAGALVARRGVGYARSSRHADVPELLRQEGYSEAELLRTGLLKLNKQGEPYNPFYQRLMWPIRDLERRVTGFTGRTLRPVVEGNPKYYNTASEAPDGTPTLYRKSYVLLGMEHLRSTEGPVYISEGPPELHAIDAAHQWAGVPLPAALGTCGTALTVQHAQVLKENRDPKRPLIFIFNNDKNNAGAKALVNVWGKVSSLPGPLFAITPEAANDLGEIHQDSNRGPREVMRQLQSNQRPLVDAVIDAKLRLTVNPDQHNKKAMHDKAGELIATHLWEDLRRTTTSPDTQNLEEIALNYAHRMADSPWRLPSVGLMAKILLGPSTTKGYEDRWDAALERAYELYRQTTVSESDATETASAAQIPVATQGEPMTTPATQENSDAQAVSAGDRQPSETFASYIPAQYFDPSDDSLRRLSKVAKDQYAHIPNVAATQAGHITDAELARSAAAYWSEQNPIAQFNHNVEYIIDNLENNSRREEKRKLIMAASDQLSRLMEAAVAATRVRLNQSPMTEQDTHQISAEEIRKLTQKLATVIAETMDRAKQINLASGSMRQTLHQLLGWDGSYLHEGTAEFVPHFKAATPGIHAAAASRRRELALTAGGERAQQLHADIDTWTRALSKPKTPTDQPPATPPPTATPTAQPKPPQGSTTAESDFSLTVLRDGPTPFRTDNWDVAAGQLSQEFIATLDAHRSSQRPDAATPRPYGTLSGTPLHLSAEDLRSDDPYLVVWFGSPPERPLSLPASELRTLPGSRLLTALEWEAAYANGANPQPLSTEWFAALERTLPEEQHDTHVTKQEFLDLLTAYAQQEASEADEIRTGRAHQAVLLFIRQRPGQAVSHLSNSTHRWTRSQQGWNFDPRPPSTAPTDGPIAPPPSTDAPEHFAQVKEEIAQIRAELSDLAADAETAAGTEQPETHEPAQGTTTAQQPTTAPAATPTPAEEQPSSGHAEPQRRRDLVAQQPELPEPAKGVASPQQPATEPAETPTPIEEQLSSEHAELQRRLEEIRPHKELLPPGLYTNLSDLAAQIDLTMTKVRRLHHNTEKDQQPLMNRALRLLVRATELLSSLASFLNLPNAAVERFTARLRGAPRPGSTVPGDQLQAPRGDRRLEDLSHTQRKLEQQLAERKLNPTDRTKFQKEWLINRVQWFDHYKQHHGTPPGQLFPQGSALVAGAPPVPNITAAYNDLIEELRRDADSKIKMNGKNDPHADLFYRAATAYEQILAGQAATNTYPEGLITPAVLRTAATAVVRQKSASPLVIQQAFGHEMSYDLANHTLQLLEARSIVSKLPEKGPREPLVGEGDIEALLTTSPAPAAPEPPSAAPPQPAPPASQAGHGDYFEEMLQQRSDEISAHAASATAPRDTVRLGKSNPAASRTPARHEEAQRVAAAAQPAGAGHAYR